MHIYDVYHFFYNIMKTTYQNCRQNNLREVSVIPIGKWMARINQGTSCTRPRKMQSHGGHLRGVRRQGIVLHLSKRCMRFAKKTIDLSRWDRD